MKRNESLNSTKWLMMCLTAVFLAPVPALKASELTVWTIQASNADDTVSKELKPLARKLKNMLLFKGYKLVKQESRDVKVDEPAVFKLPEGYEATLTHKGVESKKVKLSLSVVQRIKKKKPESKLTTTVRIVPGRFQLAGGWELEDETVLILAVSGK